SGPKTPTCERLRRQMQLPGRDKLLHPMNSEKLNMGRLPSIHRSSILRSVMSWVVVATGLSMQACAQRTPASTTTPDNGVEYIAHRGESADAPENTLAAFLLAWERDVPAIELDVHQAADGELVVIHDATTERTTG